MKTTVHIPVGSRRMTAEYTVPEGTAVFPAVIFSHGFNGARTDFDDLVALFSENGLGALCLSFCGGGLRDDSGFGTAHMTLDTEQEDLLAALDFLRDDPRVEKIFLFGGSQGGMVSALTAGKHPQGIAGLMLLFPALCIPDDWKAKFPDPAAMPDPMEFWGVPLGRCFCQSAHDTDVWGTLPRYPGPVLIFHGDQDAIVNLSYAEKALEVYRARTAETARAALEVFPGEGHGFSAPASARMGSMALDFVLDILKETSSQTLT